MPRLTILTRTILVTLLLCSTFNENVYGQKGKPKASSIRADVVYPINKKIVLKSSYESKDARYVWDVFYLPRNGFPTPLSDDQYEEVGSTLYLWGGEGSYMATVTATDFEAKKQERTKFTFSIGKPKPPDPPIPPIPPDPPIPPLDNLQGSSIEVSY